MPWRKSRRLRASSACAKSKAYGPLPVALTGVGGGLFFSACNFQRGAAFPYYKGGAPFRGIAYRYPFKKHAQRRGEYVCSQRLHALQLGESADTCMRGTGALQTVFRINMSTPLRAGRLFSLRKNSPKAAEFRGPLTTEKGCFFGTAGVKFSYQRNLSGKSGRLCSACGLPPV